MKRRIIPLLVSLGLGAISSQTHADDLLQVYQLAQHNDPTVNRAAALKEAAFKGISLSRAELLPQITGNISYTDFYNENAQPFLNDQGEIETPIVTFEQNVLSWGARLDISVYDHSLWQNLSRAEQVAQQSDADLAVAKQDLIVRTTQAYLSILRARDNLEFVKAEKRAIERQLEQTKQRFEVGLTAITDVHEAQANFDNTVAQEIRAENEVELRLEEMREITGKYHADINVLDTEKFSTARPNPERVDGWLSIAEEQSLDLMSRRIAKDIAEKDIDIAKAGRLPTVGFSAQDTRSDTEQSINGGQDIILPITERRNFGLNVSVPIYLGNRVSHRAAQARYQYVAASEDLELTYRSTVRSVRSSYNDVTAAISTIRALEQAVVSAESALKATEAGFEVGTRTIVDVLQSTRNLFDAKRNLAGARYDYILAIFNLKRAAGNLTEADIVAINNGLGAPAS